MPKLTQKQVIEAVKGLKDIKPRQEWVSLLKSQILAETPAERKIEMPAKTIGILEVLKASLFQKQFAYALGAFIFVVVGMFGFAQYTVPGDILFPVKKITEQFETPLKVAVRRSDEAVQVAKDKRDITPALSELRASISDAAKNLASAVVKNDKESIKQIAVEVLKIEENKKKLQTLGIDMGQTQETKDLDNALAPLVEAEIADLENTTLTDSQKETLKEIEDLYTQVKYSEALEKILTITD